MNDKSFTFDNLIQLGGAADAGVCGPDGCIVELDAESDTDPDADPAPDADAESGEPETPDTRVHHR